MINRVQEYLPSADENQHEQQSGVKGKIQHYLNWAQRKIADHPKAALGLGVVLGVTLGWLTKRR